MQNSVTKPQWAEENSQDFIQKRNKRFLITNEISDLGGKP